MTAVTQDNQITWEKLPDDYILPDDPADNIHLLWGAELVQKN